MKGSSLVAVWIAIILLTAALIGGAGGVLSWLDAHSVPRAVLVGASAAGGVLVLSVAAAGLFIQMGRRPPVK